MANLKKKNRVMQGLEKDLRKVERKYQQLLETLHEGIWAIDKEQYTTFVSPRLAEMLGYTVAEMIGKHLFDFMDEPAVLVCQQYLIHRRQGISEKHDFEFIKKDGSRMYALVGATPLTDEEGNYNGALAAVQDITDRKQAEENILLANERLRFLLSSTSAVIYTAKAADDYEATFISQNVSQLTGHEPSEFTDNASFWLNHIHPVDVEGVLAELPHIFENELYTYEYRFRHKNGTYLWMRDEMKLVRSKFGEPIEIIGYWIDITDRKHAEEALRKSEERFRELAELLPQTVFEIDTHAVVTFVNKTGLITFGLSETDIKTGFNQINTFVPADRKRALENINRIVEGENIGEKGIEYNMQRQDGSTFPAIIYAVVILHEGVSVGVRGIVVDVTDQKYAAEKIKNSLREKEMLLREIHHRVKNNLQVVLSLLNIQSRKIDDEKYLNTFKEIQHRVYTMALIHEKLYQSKDLTKIDVAQYIRTLTRYLIQTYKMERIQLRTNISSIHLGINTAIPCGLIINELVSNSLKHAFQKGASGTISIDCFFNTSDTLILIIKDDGCGFPKDLINKDSLGLKLVKMLSEQLKGTVTFATDEGTQVKIEFPVQ
ncbi:PAS domain S-box protein [candidate division CSSED10-310 bacterium]|uniref:histidine kinase n=1 Tax=candidate division CSSED10-310 bacterium TaxID=2855610 RepID=A0ABV6Z1I9_UNCC1